MATQTPRKDNLHGEESITPRFSDELNSPGVYDDQKIPSGNSSGSNESSSSLSRDELKEKEMAAEDGSSSNVDSSEGKLLSGVKNKVGRGYSEEENRLANLRKRLGLTRKKGVALLITGVLGGGGIFGFSIIQGPLQVVHLAQLLQSAHFGNQEDAADGRTGRLYRYLRADNDVGETRLGYLASKQKTVMLNDLKKLGLNPDYGSAKTYRGFSIDTENRSSPYFGMNENEVKRELARKGVKAGISRDGNTIKVSTDGFFAQRKSHRVLAKDAGYGRIAAPLRARALDKYGLVSWHPMKKLDRKVNETVADRYKRWKEERDNRLKKGVVGTTIDGSNAKETNTDADGNTTETDHSSAPDSPDQDKSSKILNDIKSSGSLKVAGGLAAATGLVCSAKEVNDNIGAIRFVQVVKPLIRIAMDIVTSGDQTKSGDDVDMEQIGFLSKDFNEKDKNGKLVSSINEAKTFKAEAGKPGGRDIDPATKELITEGSPDWLNWTETGAVGALCSGVGQVASGIVSVTIGVLSGGTISTASGAVAGALAGPLVIDKLSKTLSGNAVNVAQAGAERGNYANFGARMGANQAALLAGGAKMSTSEERRLDAMRQLEENDDFAAKNIASRLFDLDDRRSLVSSVIDSTPELSVQSTPELVHGTFSSLLSSVDTPLGIFFSDAHAASTNYDYGFPAYGFSIEEQEIEFIQDPYDNAEKVAAILQSTPAYTEKANECFGVLLEKGANGWTVRANPDAGGGEGINIYDEKYDADSCADKNNTDWTRVRFFIMDTGVMQSLACYQGDDESCVELGVSTAASSGEGATSADDGNCNGGRDLGTQDTYTAGRKTNRKICAMPAAGGTTIEVASEISKNIADLLAAAKREGINFTGYGFRTMAKQEQLYAAYQSGSGVEAARPGYSNHQSGLAIDFGIGGQSLCYPSPASACRGNSGFDWLRSNASKYGLKNYPGEAWHWSTTGN